MLPEYKFKARHYLHFDLPLSPSKAKALATDPAKVGSHAFYPLLSFTVTTPKVKKNDDGSFTRTPKERPIKICAHSDAAIYSYYAQILSIYYEAELATRGLTEAVTAFRRHPGRQMNNVAFAEEVFCFIQVKRPCLALGLDVSKFFDRLDHDYLKTCWQDLLGVQRLPKDHFSVYKSLANFCSVDRTEAFKEFSISPHNPKPKALNRQRICTADEFRKKIRGSGMIQFNPEISQKRGIPQGTPISAILSNIYMLEFDAAMHAAASQVGGLYRRYCDDIMVVAPPTEAQRIEDLAMEQIALLKLDINEGKTHRVEFPADKSHVALENKTLQYLGFTFSGTQKLIRASSLSRYYSKMRRGVSLARKTRAKYNSIEQSKGLPESPLRKRKLYLQYSYLISGRFKNRKGTQRKGTGNFLTYAYDAAKRMNAPEIKGQMKNHWRKLQEEMKK
ncbi:reverse transcriptase/maturase family protein [Coraliomargarita sp. SDUM461003]|uniref:Reverse transcriptase/maturase family protein n=1 Tax=Thalassobacterium maritimum TaxID=3041265 RepID=A0ABU1AS71_9BACT|nr:antiviral reverse transcriptase Drt2 [Coraliomargarita sp. SDUM461003]MDQ8207011.1 reverse transcriptase/maturase family protein [Coraliomargarita sp. SDUM461003]